MGQGSKSCHIDTVTEVSSLVLRNSGSVCIGVLQAFWVDFNGQEQLFQEIQTGATAVQSTYSTHLWRVRQKSNGQLLGEYAGPSCMLVVTADGRVAVQPTPVPAAPHPSWGEYAVRARSAAGVPIMAYQCVDPQAVVIAARLVDHMLQLSPPVLVNRLLSAGAVVGIIGRHQVTTDIPAHSFMKLQTNAERDTDTTTRGLGGCPGCPTTSCGEENLLMEDDRFYPSENILVHEFGHACMELGMSADERQLIERLYSSAHASGSYAAGSYIMENAAEYWAEGTQAWFEATVREDATSGINTRAKLKAHDPGLAKALGLAYGDGPWRYQHDSPGKLQLRNAVPATASAAVAPTATVVMPASDEGPGSWHKWHTQPGVAMQRMTAATEPGHGARTLVESQQHAIPPLLSFACRSGQCGGGWGGWGSCNPTCSHGQVGLACNPQVQPFRWLGQGLFSCCGAGSARARHLSSKHV